MKNFGMIAGSSIVLIFAAIYVFQTDSNEDGKNSPTEIKLSKIPFYDWQLSSGKTADKIRPLISSSLIDISDSGKAIPRLVGKMQIIQTGSIIELRTSAHWSDGVNFNSTHIVDAFTRWKKDGESIGWIAENEDQKRWAKNINIVALAPHQIKLVGFKDRKDLHNLLASNLLRPIRSDLLKKEPVKGWKISLGAYVINKIMTQDEFLAAKTINLDPNSKYFRGPKKASIAFDLSDSGNSRGARN